MCRLRTAVKDLVWAPDLGCGAGVAPGMATWEILEAAVQADGELLTLLPCCESKRR